MSEAKRKRIVLHVPTDLANRVTKWARAREKAEPGLALSRNEAIGMLLEKALAPLAKRG